ncbi:RagB/SusD family nutrient uptake outer membrane protein [Flagellimonas amoyensis]|uniref:RagB/SusD family nutrient uptake outer membrane protein n=1 Tax=Flagellimonas amoyensis TaxID=2169401 RepID=UPI000D365A09|nr:RagB/SusD family nutrient uptake outer membrane protein [Allomuricauda amoyensis]
MKNYKILVFVSIIFMCSCEDVLEKEPLDLITDATVWKDPVLSDSYLDQCYAEMKFYFESDYGFRYGDYFDQFTMVHAYGIADEALKSWDENFGFGFSITVNGGVYEWWGYPTIRKLNIFIEEMEVSSLSDSYRIQRTAEARFLRAFAYFNLVKRYGGVPLITKSLLLDDSEEELYPVRNKEMEIYDFILSELNAIESDLLDEEEGRPSGHAALALKSRVAMYAGSIASWGTPALDGIVGIPQNMSTSYWQASFDASKQIIDSGVFELYNQDSDKVTNFRNLFLDEGNSEVIFSERFNGLSGKGHSWDMWQAPFSYHPWGKGQYSSLYLEMVESFDNIDGTAGIIDRDKIASGYAWTVEELWGNKDPRFKASVYTQGTSWLNGSINLDFHAQTKTPEGTTNVGFYKGVPTKSVAFGRKTPFGILKYLDEEERSVQMERNFSDTDYIIFRLGEIYLNYAEAAIELGNDGEALWAINKIRERAGMPLYTSISRDLVRKERKVELAFEGNRYFDLRRWRVAENELSQGFHGLQFTLDGSSFEEGSYDVLTAKYILTIENNVNGTPTPIFDERNYYLPIGLSRTGQNPNLEENPGYR